VYDANGLVWSQADPSGEVTTFGYDAADREIARTDECAPPVVGWASAGRRLGKHRFSTSKGPCAGRDAVENAEDGEVGRIGREDGTNPGLIIGGRQQRIEKPLTSKRELLKPRWAGAGADAGERPGARG
jgi:YD repeat-containing protein